MDSVQLKEAVIIINQVLFLSGPLETLLIQPNGKLGGLGGGLRRANLLGHQLEVVLQKIFRGHCDTFLRRLGEDSDGGEVWGVRWTET